MTWCSSMGTFSDLGHDAEGHTLGPTVKGNTSAGAEKPALMETGVEIEVCPFHGILNGHLLSSCQPSTSGPLCAHADMDGLHSGFS